MKSLFCFVLDRTGLAGASKTRRVPPAPTPNPARGTAPVLGSVSLGAQEVKCYLFGKVVF